MSRHYTIKDAAWLLLAVFSQVYNENPEQKAEQTDLKNTVWSENKYIQAADKGAVAKEVNDIKKRSQMWTLWATMTTSLATGIHWCNSGINAMG